MKKLFNPIVLRLSFFFYALLINSILAEDMTQKINIIERLTRIEEGQKAIISEMKARFDASDKRFESILREMNQRFNSVDQRFESIDKRFESIEKRFESIEKRFESIEKNFESIEKRFENRFISIENRFISIENRLEIINNYIIAIIGMIITIFLAIIANSIWDKKTKKNSDEKSDSQQAFFSPLNTDQEKMNQMLDIMKKMSEKIPEMEKMMRAANLL